MFAVIASSLFSGQIKKAIYDSEGQIVYNMISTNIDIIDALQEVDNLDVDYLIIDMVSVENHRDIPFAIRDFRIKNENTQIIIIAPNCYPGNQELSLIVTMGVYDILNPIGDNLNDYDLYSDLLEVLKYPTTYAKAVKWDLGLNALSQNVKANSNQNVVTIVKDKIVGTMVIGVVGTMHRIGTTHTAINIASFLKTFNVKVGLVELNKTTVFEDIKNSYIDVKDIDNGFLLDGIYFYPNKEDMKLLNILEDDFNYIVLDLGVYNDCQLEEFKRADERIIVSGVKDWELGSLEAILRTRDGIHKNKYLFNFSDEETFAEIKENMVDLRCYLSSLTGNPFLVNKNSYKMCAKLLENIIPKQDGKRKGLKFNISGIFKKEK
ncbi:hypothetical protein [Abyssisolibacter fermentans]|uniref:hypothetical protein n=1 Tax=Abyssisolibacter fermentans TaxID=1766203 RepID=UPI0012E33A5F|nr:hypothetical protein [Abyssisolibacter fermentans]